MKKILLSVFAVMALALITNAQCPFVEQSTGFTAPSRGINSVCAVDDQVVWATAYDGSGSSAPCQDFTRTTNGGTSWTPGTISGITHLDIAMVSAVDDMNAWVAVFPPASNSTNQGIYHTSDGGASWARQTTAEYTNASSFCNIVHFWDANTGWCQGDAINGDFEMYTTVNGGTTWTLVPGANIPDPLSGEWGVVGYYSVVDDIVWYGTNVGRVYKSIDKGLNWTVSDVPPFTGLYIQPFFRSEDVGLCMDKDASTTGDLTISTDGGTTWAALSTTGTNYSNDLGYVPGTPSTWVSTGAAEGLSGVTYTYDDGSNWTEWLDCQGVQFLATDWIDTETGWAGSFNTDASAGGMWNFTGNLVPPIAPTADFEADLTSVMLGESVTFTDLSTGDPTSWAWTFDGGLPGTSYIQVPPMVQYNTPGSFDVTLAVTNTNGTDTKTLEDYIYVGGVGIGDNKQVTVAIYPNPVQDVLNIKGAASIQEVQIINLVGQVVYTQKVDNDFLKLNLSNLRSGIYNLKVKIADGFINKKIVVN